MLYCMDIPHISLFFIGHQFAICVCFYIAIYVTFASFKVCHFVNLVSILLFSNELRFFFIIKFSECLRTQTKSENDDVFFQISK